MSLSVIRISSTASDEPDSSDALETNAQLAINYIRLKTDPDKRYRLKRIANRKKQRKLSIKELITFDKK